MKYTHIIWDFNGTILDDVSIGIESINVLLSKRGLPTIDSVDSYRKMFCFPIKDYYLRCGFDFSKDDYETVLAPEWVKEYKKRESYAQMCKGVRKALELFSENGIKQTVISASSSDMLTEQIDRLGIKQYFSSVIGCNNFFAYGKSKLCCDFVDSMPADKFILVGDSTHDYEVACAAGIDCALVLSGHMDKEQLSQCACPLFSDAFEFAEFVIE